MEGAGGLEKYFSSPGNNLMSFYDITSRQFIIVIPILQITTALYILIWKQSPLNTVDLLLSKHAYASTEGRGLSKGKLGD